MLGRALKIVEHYKIVSPLMAQCAHLIRHHDILSAANAGLALSTLMEESARYVYEAKEMSGINFFECDPSFPTLDKFELVRKQYEEHKANLEAKIAAEKAKEELIKSL